MRSIDRGLTHVAFMVKNMEASIAFYERYADMSVVHQRADAGGDGRVAWISDGTRPFVIVLIESPLSFPGSGLIPRALTHLLPHFAHLGVACGSREEVDEACEKARNEGILEMEPQDLGDTVGYLGLIKDPDGNSLEVSYGQEVGLAVALGNRSDP
ncbi:VOC family protein [Myxococcota bacterium]|nr:VOC family protein [Myxococcota bacterium]